MAFRLLPTPFTAFFDVNGNPAAGHTLEFFIFNTSTPVALYSNSTGTALGTSCTLNSLGRPQTSGGAACMLFGDTDQTAGYKIVQKDSLGSIVQTFDGPIFCSTIGADLVSGGVSYDGGTVEEALDDVMVVSGVRQGITAGTNIDTEFAQWCIDYANTGTVLKLRLGVYTTTAHYEVEGWTLDLSAGAEIEVNGTDAELFADGAFELLEGGRIVGGIVYTSGSMEGTFGGDACVLYCNGGEIDGTTVYSQINTGIKHASGKLKATVIGAKWRGVYSIWAADVLQDVDVKTFNTGCRYIAKVPQASGNTAGVFAYLVWFTVSITSQVLIKFTGQYSSSSGLWIQSPSDANDMTALTLLHPVFDHAGYYLASGTTPTVGNESGTALEIRGCPGAEIIDPVSVDPRGYNIALVASENAVIHGGVSNGIGGDPCVVILNSDGVIVYNHIADGGTVGYSIGEDGQTSNNVKIIGCTGKDCSFGPIRFVFNVDDTKLFIDRFTAINGSKSAGFAGSSFSGPGELYDFCRVYSYTPASITRAHVSLTNSTLNGEYTELFRGNDANTVVHVYENNNTFACPYVPPALGTGFRSKGMFQSRNMGVPMITGGSGGRAGVGTQTINNATVNSSFVLNVTDIEPYVGTLAAASADEADFYLLVYVQYATNMTGQIRIGLDDSGASSTSRYQVTAFMDSIIGNSGNMLGDGYQVGEWVPLEFTLRSAVYSGVTDLAALTRIQVVKFGYSINYELVMTNPVIVMRKAIT